MDDNIFYLFVICKNSQIIFPVLNEKKNKLIFVPRVKLHIFFLWLSNEKNNKIRQFLLV